MDIRLGEETNRIQIEVTANQTQLPNSRACLPHRQRSSHKDSVKIDSFQFRRVGRVGHYPSRNTVPSGSGVSVRLLASEHVELGEVATVRAGVHYGNRQRGYRVQNAASDADGIASRELF